MATEDGAARGVRAGRHEQRPAQRESRSEAWLSWARRSRLEPFRKLTKTITERFEAGPVRGMTDWLTTITLAGALTHQFCYRR